MKKEEALQESLNRVIGNLAKVSGVAEKNEYLLSQLLKQNTDLQLSEAAIKESENIAHGVRLKVLYLASDLKADMEKAKVE